MAGGGAAGVEPPVNINTDTPTSPSPATGGRGPALCPVRGRCDQTNHRGIIKALARELSEPWARLGLCGDDLAVRGEEIAVSE